MAEFYTFDEVMQELQIDEEELKRLISQGELRGFRDGDEIKFRRDDVLNLKKNRETEPTIILTDSDHSDSSLYRSSCRASSGLASIMNLKLARTIASSPRLSNRSVTQPAGFTSASATFDGWKSDGA